MAKIQTVTPASLDIEEVLSLYNSVGWSAYTDDSVALNSALRGSATIVEARDDSELVGIARVISDNASICYLQDVLVHPDHQRRGIGRALVIEALGHYPHVRQKVLITDDEPAQKAFYESLGYKEVAEFGNGTLRAFIRFDHPSSRPGNRSANAS